MKKITLLFLSFCMIALTINAQSTSFESVEGFTLGNLDTQNGWGVFAAYPDIPVVTDADASDGTYSMHLIGTNIPGNSGAFSPTFTSSMDVIITVDMYVGTSPTDNASDIDFLTQSPSQALLTSRIKFSFDDTVLVLDDIGAGAEFVDSGAIVIRDAWFELKMEFIFSESQILYYIDDVLIYTGSVFGGTNVEQMITLSDNYDSDGYFDNIVYQDGLTLSTQEEVLSEMNITAYPNPTKEDLNINFSKSIGNTKVTVLDVTGKVVMTSEIEGIGSKTLNTSSLANGVYFAQLSGESVDTTIKFIKD